MIPSMSLRILKISLSLSTIGFIVIGTMESTSYSSLHLGSKFDKSLGMALSKIDLEMSMEMTGSQQSRG